MFDQDYEFQDSNVTHETVQFKMTWSHTPFILHAETTGSLPVSDVWLFASPLLFRLPLSAFNKTSGINDREKLNTF